MPTASRTRQFVSTVRRSLILGDSLDRSQRNLKVVEQVACEPLKLVPWRTRTSRRGCMLPLILEELHAFRIGDVPIVGLVESIASHGSGSSYYDPAFAGARACRFCRDGM